MVDVTHSIPVQAANALSVAAILGAFAGWLPPIAAAISIIWFALEIYESKTVQDWLKRRKAHRRRRHTAKYTYKRTLRKTPQP